MAKIIYGVAGQGFGHSTRSREIITHLQDQGHQILVFTYGQALFMLEKDFEVHEITGLGLSYKNNKLVYWQTVVKNTQKVFKESQSFGRSLKKFKDFNPDLVITDFEPLTSILAKVQNKPLISIDNQHQLTHTKIQVPKKYLPDLMIDKFIVRSFVWQANYYLVTSFYPTQPKSQKVFWFPPIVRRQVLKLKPTKQDYILVYQTSDYNGLVKQLKQFQYRFVVFGLDIEKQVENIAFKKFSQDEWLEYLANCQAIIGNAGLSTMSEALYLKKPYLAVPVKKQIEQVVNAYYLDKLGYGMMADKLNLNVFANFVTNLDKYRQALAKYSYTDNSLILNKVDELINKLVR